jgi:hypothetical protein
MAWKIEPVRLPCRAGTNVTAIGLVVSSHSVVLAAAANYEGSAKRPSGT